VSKEQQAVPERGVELYAEAHVAVPIGLTQWADPGETTMGLFVLADSEPFQMVKPTLYDPDTA
jgi:hypothetical protein